MGSRRGGAWTRWCGGLWMLLLLGATGCGPSSAPPSPSATLRIVSLAPAITQMVVDLGLASQLVGVAQYDDAAPKGLPVVGIYTEIDTEKLLSVAPTHVLMMVGKDGPPARLTELASAGRFELVVYPYPYRLAQVLDIFTDPDQGVGAVLGQPQQARTLGDTMKKALQSFQSQAATRPHPRVLMVIGLSPVMASGHGTVLDEMLTYVGGVNAAASTQITAPTFDREALIGLGPDVILLLKPGAPPLTENDPRLADFAGLPIPAVRAGRIVLLNDPLALLPSTHMVRIMQQMRQALDESRP